MRLTLLVRALPVPMIEPTFRTPLVTAVGGAASPEPGFGAARQAAIALSLIAVRTDPVHRVTTLAETNSRTENHLAMNRHAPCWAALWQRQRFMAG